MTAGVVFGSTFATPSELPEEGVTVFQAFEGANCTGSSNLQASANLTAGCGAISNTTTDGITIFFSDAHVSCNRGSGLLRNSYASTSDSSVCDASDNYLQVTTPIGVCVNDQDGTSHVNWCSRLDAESLTAPPPQPIETGPVPDAWNQPCSGDIAEGCGPNLATLRAYTDPSCSGEAVAALSPFVKFLPALPILGTCYQYPAFNFKAICGEDYYMLNLTTGGCGPNADLLESVAMPLDTCQYYAPGLWGIASCPAAAPSDEPEVKPIEDEDPSAPSSPSSANQPARPSSPSSDSPSSSSSPSQPESNPIGGPIDETPAPTSSAPIVAAVPALFLAVFFACFYL